MIYATCCQCIAIWGKRNRFGRLDIAGKNMIYDFDTRCYTRSIRLRCVWGFVFKGFFVWICGEEKSNNRFSKCQESVYTYWSDYISTCFKSFSAYVPTVFNL